MNIRTEDIEGIIWDLDNTLYRFDNDFEHACNIAAGKAALHMGVDMPLDEAIAYADHSYLTTGMSLTLFAKEYHLEERDLHAVFHTYIDETMINACQQTVRLFEKLNRKNVLLTHGSKDWAVRTLTHLGLFGWFGEEMIIGRECMDFQHKGRSQKPFELARGKIDLDEKNIVVVEDLFENLKYPKEMGMQTVFLHHGAVPKDIPDYVDWACDNAPQFLEKILGQ